jgi:putative nucleotidyltransferase with HDIG domain
MTGSASWDKFLFLLPYLISFAITLGVFLYTLKYRHTRGASAYLWYVGAQTLWTAGFLFETLSPTLAGKIFWDKIQWIPGCIIAIAFPVFAIYFTDLKIKHPKRLWILLSLIPALFFLIVVTDSWHHQLYPNPHLNQSAYFPELTYHFTWTVYLFAIYDYLVTFGGIGILFRQFRSAQKIYRQQILTIAFGFFIPIVATILTTIGIEFKPYRDLAPITFALGNLIIAWGLFRFHTFDIVPIARDKVVENMTDLFVVVDDKDRVVDINRVALETMHLSEKNIIGQLSETVFADWPILLEKFSNAENMHTDIEINNGKNPAYYEVNSTLLHDKRGMYIGRVFIARDVTFHVQLNNELEARVRQRTQELAEAYDTTLEGWAKALEFRDKETEGHSRRVTEITQILAKELGCTEEEIVQMRRGSILHDIGKMAIPDEILRKKGKLTAQEREIICQHPKIAYQLLSPIPFLKDAMKIPYYHHEKWDGTGYPLGLKGKDIPLAARIFAIADVWDAIQSDRPYNKAWPKKKAIEYIKAQAGQHFDPEIVQVFLKLIEQGRI